METTILPAGSTHAAEGTMKEEVATLPPGEFSHFSGLTQFISVEFRFHSTMFNCSLYAITTLSLSRGLAGSKTGIKRGKAPSDRPWGLSMNTVSMDTDIECRVYGNGSKVVVGISVVVVVIVSSGAVVVAPMVVVVAPMVVVVSA